jgi:hypothetical protein
LVVLSSAVGRLVVGFFGGSAAVGSAFRVGLAVVVFGLAIVAFDGISATWALGGSGFAGVTALRTSVVGLIGRRVVALGALLPTPRVFAVGFAIVASAGLTLVGSTAALLATDGFVLAAFRSGVGAALSVVRAVLAAVRAGVVGAVAGVAFAAGLAATGEAGRTGPDVAFAFGRATSGVGSGGGAWAGSAFEAATRVAFGLAIVASAGVAGVVSIFGADFGRAAVRLGFAISASAGIAGVVSTFDACAARAAVAFGRGFVIVGSAGTIAAAAAAATAPAASFFAAAAPRPFSFGLAIVASTGTTGTTGTTGAAVLAALLVAGFVGGGTAAVETFATGLMIVAFLGLGSGTAASASVAKAASATACLAAAASRSRRSVLAATKALPTGWAGTVAPRPARTPAGWRTVISSEISAADVRRLHQTAVVAGNPIPTMP